MPSLHGHFSLSKQERRDKRKFKRKLLSGFLIFAFSFSALFLIAQSIWHWSSPEAINDINNTNIDLTITKRRLKDKLDDDYYINSLEDFPPLLFTLQQTKDGAWILNFIGMFYCFLGIAIICDDYFVPAIEVIVEKLQMSEDTAGATWMAAGGSAPELFTAFIGTFLAKSDVGFGTIVGSAVFNVLFIIGACAIFTPGNLPLTWWPFARDMSYYLISLCMLSLFFGGISQNQIKWWESVILLCMYFLYVFMMWRNEKIKAWFYRKFIDSADEQGLLTENDNSTEISMQIKRTPRDPIPISPRESIPENTDSNADLEIAKITDVMGNGSTGGYGSTTPRTTVDTVDDNDKDGDNDDDDDDDDEEEGPDISWPEGIWAQFWYLMKAPLAIPIYYTLFDCSNEDYEDWWPWTFFGSLCWLGALSYLMVWWAVVVGFAWTIPQELMGLVFLAAGTSVPELFSCIIVAKKGKADMAVSASIGSNIFDVLVGLPLPWLMFSIIYNERATDMHINVKAHGLFLSILVLVVLLFLLLILILINKWVLTHCMGYSMIALYVFFVTQDLLRHYVWDIEF